MDIDATFSIASACSSSSLPTSVFLLGTVTNVLHIRVLIGISKNKQTRNNNFSYHFFSSSARKISGSSNFSPSLSDGGSLIR